MTKSQQKVTKKVMKEVMKKVTKSYEKLPKHWFGRSIQNLSTFEIDVRTFLILTGESVETPEIIFVNRPEICGPPSFVFI